MGLWGRADDAIRRCHRFLENINWRVKSNAKQWWFTRSLHLYSFVYQVEPLNNMKTNLMHRYRKNWRTVYWGFLLFFIWFFCKKNTETHFGACCFFITQILIELQRSRTPWWLPPILLARCPYVKDKIGKNKIKSHLSFLNIWYPKVWIINFKAIHTDGIYQV